MLDIRVIRENPAAVQERLKNRGGDHWKLIDDVLAVLAGRMGTSGLAEKAAHTLATLGYASVEVHVGDGTRGWPSGAP